MRIREVVARLGSRRFELCPSNMFRRHDALRNILDRCRAPGRAQDWALAIASMRDDATFLHGASVWSPSAAPPLFGTATLGENTVTEA